MNKGLRQKIKMNQPVIGTWNTMDSVLSTEVLASSGIDFLIIDFEHGPFQIANVHNFINASLLYNCSPIVRVPKNTQWMSLQALDQGANGIMMPGIKNKRSAKKFIDQIKYAPVGKRGYSPFTKSGGFSNENLNYKNEANELTTSIIIIEDMDGLNNIDEILEVDALDVIYFGAYDLSQVLGFPGDVYNNRLLDLLKPAIEKVTKIGKFAGGFVPQNKDELIFVKELGINFITYGVDTNILHKSLKAINDWFKFN